MCDDVIVEAVDTPEEARARHLLTDLGFCGHYLHFHSGGRSGKAPILCLLAKNGGTMSQQELGSHFELKPGSLSEVLAKLETCGLIERTRNPDDRRQLLPSTSPTPVAPRRSASSASASISAAAPSPA